MKFVVAWRGGVSSARASELAGRFLDVKCVSVAYTASGGLRIVARSRRKKRAAKSSLPKECRCLGGSDVKIKGSGRVSRLSGRILSSQERRITRKSPCMPFISFRRYPPT